MTALERFGAFFKAKRMATGKTLREFCLHYDLDAGNTSRIERGRCHPPKNRAILERYAGQLGLQAETDDWSEFFNLAAAANRVIPHECLTDEEVVAKLPLLFRRLSGRKVNDEDLDSLVELIRHA